MYRSMKVQVTEGPVYDWCYTIAHKANNLYNAALYRERQLMCSRGKAPSELSANEAEVLREFEEMNRILQACGKRVRQLPDSGVLSYNALDDLMKCTGNPDYFCDELPRQTAQSVLKHTVRDLTSFFEAVKAYKSESARFNGYPQLPHYKHK